MSTLDQHVLRATLGPNELAVDSATLILDEGWAPYGQATIVCPLPADLDTIDPRLGLRLDLRSEQSYGSGPSIADYTTELGGSIAAWTAAFGGSIPAINAAHFRAFNSFGLRDSTSRIASLSLRHREIDWASRTVTLGFTTDEALLQAYALVASGIFEPANVSVRSLVVYVLSLVGAFLETGADDGTLTASAAQWIPGVSAWDYLAPLVQQAGLRLYCDEMRRWYLVTDTTILDGQLQLVDAVNLTADKDTIGLDGDWYDAVVVTYTWIDELGVSQRAWDTASQPGFTKVFNVEYNLPYPGPGAAANVLTRTLGRGRVQEVRAVSDYTATPGQAVSLTITGDETQVGYVASVEWKWPDAEMSVKSRGLIEAPPTAWILDTPGVSWAAIPVGIDWTEDI